MVPRMRCRRVTRCVACLFVSLLRWEMVEGGSGEESVFVGCCMFWSEVRAFVGGVVIIIMVIWAVGLLPYSYFI